MEKPFNKKALALFIEDIAATSPVKASRQLEVFALDLTDRQLTEVIEEIGVLTIASINEQHDYSSPSITASLMSTSKAIDLISESPVYWKAKIMADPAKVSFASLDLITYLLGVREDTPELQCELLEAVAKNENALFFFSIPFFGVGIEEFELEEADELGLDSLFVQNLDSLEGIFSLIHHRSPEVAQLILQMVSGADFSASEAIMSIAKHLRDVAEKRIVQQKKVMVDTNDMFAPLA